VIPFQYGFWIGDIAPRRPEDLNNVTAAGIDIAFIAREPGS
jgi:hypothetical protein